MKMILGKYETRGIPVIIIIIALVLSICFVIATLYEKTQMSGKITWYSIDEIDKAEKLIFLDVSTKWYKPCNMMDEYTFKNNKVSSFIQSNFFPVKIDGGDSLGIEFCKNYQITVYPTLLIIEPKTKKEIKRIEGFSAPDPLLKELQEIIDTQTE